MDAINQSQGERCEASVSKIVIGALTAAVWFALVYVARAESVGGQVSDQGTYISQDLSQDAAPASGVVHRLGVTLAR